MVEGVAVGAVCVASFYLWLGVSFSIQNIDSVGQQTCAHIYGAVGRTSWRGGDIGLSDHPSLFHARFACSSWPPLRLLGILYGDSQAVKHAQIIVKHWN